METKMNSKIANWYISHGWKLIKKPLGKKIEVEDILELYNKIQEEKEERISKKKHLPEILVPNVTEKCWGLGAFTIAFVYSNKGNFVLKGWLGDVDAYLKNLKEKGYKYFYYISMYQYGIERGYWKFYNKDVDIFEPRLRGKNKENKYHFIIKNCITKNSFKFKRLPNKWIPEFNEL